MTPRYLRFRAWLRRSGIIWLVQRHLYLRHKLNCFLYKKRKPTQYVVRVRNHEFRLHTETIEEFVGFLEKKEDIRLTGVLADRIRAGETGWDIGANIGFYTLAMAKSVGPSGVIYAFEPEPRARVRLNQNIDLNSLSNIHPIGLALANTTGKLQLISAPTGSHGFHRLDLAGDKESTSPNHVTVDVTTGDLWRTNERAAVPAIIKVDVEGVEEEVLLGLENTLREPACRTVLCEVHFAALEARNQPNAPLRIEKFLRDCGFSVRWVDRSHILACK